jgi:ribosomal protein S18 acetylase RimI-like enzyme
MKIEQANKSQLNQLLLIANSAFGDNFISKLELSTYINQPNQYLFVAIIDDEVVGFISAETCNKTELLNKVLQPIDLPKNITKIGWIKQVAINPNHYRKGIAHHLLQTITKQLKPKIDTLFCISWIKGAVTPMSNLLLKNKFTLYKTIPNYWYNDSLTKQYNCYICGTPPCKCSADLFLLN